MTDYIACGRVVPERIAAIVAGIADGLRARRLRARRRRDRGAPGAAGARRVRRGGRRVRRRRGRRPARPGPGPPRRRRRGAARAAACTPTGTRSSAGCSPGPGWGYERHVEEFGRTLGEELLEPTRIYAADALDLAGALGADLHALSHVTGGGLAANLARVLPAGVHAVVDRGDLAAGAGLRPRRPARRACRAAISSARSTSASGWSPCSTPAAPARPSSGSPRAACRPGCSVRSAARRPPGADAVDVVRGAKGVRGGAVVTVGEHPG